MPVKKGAFFTGGSLSAASLYGEGVCRECASGDGHASCHIEVLHRQGPGLNGQAATELGSPGDVVVTAVIASSDGVRSIGVCEESLVVLGGGKLQHRAATGSVQGVLQETVVGTTLHTDWSTVAVR